MIYALINLGIVENVIYATDAGTIAYSEYEYVIDVTNTVPQPCKGWRYDGTNFTKAEPESITWATAPAEYFWLDIGPFRDRFGDDWPVIASSSERECIAFREAVTEGRKYIDLKDPRVAEALDMMIATSKPTNWAMFPNSGPITPAKKAAILNQQTTDYERHIKGLPQPTE